MPARLLIVGRDARYREWLRHHLGVLCPEGTIGVLDLDDMPERSQSLNRSECDVLLLHARFGTSPEDPTSEGLEWLRQLRDRAQFPQVVVVAEDGNELTAVRAIQLGAADYLPKRLLTPDRLHTMVRLALRRAELVAEEAAASEPEAADEESGDQTLGEARSASGR